MVDWDCEQPGLQDGDEDIDSPHCFRRFSVVAHNNSRRSDYGEDGQVRMNDSEFCGSHSSPDPLRKRIFRSDELEVEFRRGLYL